MSTQHPATFAVRGVTVVAVVVVALVAAVVSFAHMQQLAAAAGEAWRSYLIPVSIDGLVVAASMVLLTRRRNGLGGGPLAWGALCGGVLASLAANMADARPEVTAVLVAGWPAVAFAVAFELLLQQRRADQAPTPAVEVLESAALTPTGLPAATYQRVEPVHPAPAPSPAPWRAEPVDTAAGVPPTAPGVPVDPRSVARHEPMATTAAVVTPPPDAPSQVASSSTPAPAGDADLVERVRRLVAESTAAGRPMGRRAIAKHLDVSEHRVRAALVSTGAGAVLNGHGPTQATGHQSGHR